MCRFSAFPGAGRLYPPRLPPLLREVRRPGGIAQAPLLVAAGEVEQLVERSGVLVDVGGWIALLPQPAWNGVETKVAKLDVRYFGPGDRAADARIRHRPDRIARGDGPVLRVLVVVDEDAVAFLLPPLAGGVLREPALDLARQSECRPAHLVVVPAPLQPHVDVDSARPRGLRVARQAVLLEHGQ